MLWLFRFPLPEGFQWTKKEVNQSVVVSQSVTLSWNVTYTGQESSQNRVVVFKRYPHNNSSAMMQMGSIFTIPLANTTYQNPFKPRITVVESASTISELAIIIQNVTKQDEAFYRIEVDVGGTVVSSQAKFLTVLGNYVYFTCCACIIDIYLYLRCIFCRNV